MDESIENCWRIRRETSDIYEDHKYTWKAGAAEWLVNKYESNKDYGVNNHWTRHGAMAGHPAKLTQTTSTVEPLMLSHTSSPTTTQSWANGSCMVSSTKSIMARSVAIFWLGTITRHVGHIRVPLLAVSTLLQKDHSQETDGHNTSDTVGEHHDSHTLTQSSLPVFFCSCESFIFQHD